MITTNIASIQDDPVGEANAEILKLMSIKQQGQTNHSGINFKHDDSNANVCSSQIVHPDKSTTHGAFSILHKAVSAKLLQWMHLLVQTQNCAV